MKQYLLLFFILFNIAALCAQDTWLHEYFATIPVPLYISEDLILCSDGGYAVNGKLWLNQVTVPFLLKTDRNCNQQWLAIDSLWTINTRANALVETDDGGFINAVSDDDQGYLSALVKHDPSGNREWVRYLEDFVCVSMQKNPEGNIVMVGQNPHYDLPAIRSVTQEGVLVDSLDIILPAFHLTGVLTSIAICPHGGYVASGALYDYTFNLTQLLTIRIAENCDTIWVRTQVAPTIFNGNNDIVVDPDENTYIWGHYHPDRWFRSLLKYDRDGNQMYFRFYQVNDIYGSLELNHEGTALYGQDTDRLIMFDPETGDSLWATGLLPTPATRIWIGYGDEAFHIVSDGFVFCGARTGIVLMKTDLLGQITANSDQIQPRIPTLEIFPNPFATQATIRFKNNTAGNVELTVFNIKGQKVRTLLNEHKQAGDWDMAWDGCDDRHNALASGVYLLRFESDGRIQHTRKVTLIK